MTRKILRRVLPWLVLAGSFAVLCVFEWRNISDLLDSDMASDMIYANLLAKEGAFFSPNWYYSSELRVFANHLSFTPLFLLTQDWRLVRGLGSMLTYALFVASVYAPIRHTSLKRFYPLVAAAMLMPLSVTYFHYSFVGTLYTHYYILSFWLMGLALGQCGASGRARAWRLILLAALSAVAGLCGLRFMLFSALPLCGAWWTGTHFSASLRALGAPQGARAEVVLEDAQGEVLARVCRSCPEGESDLGLIEATLPAFACVLELTTRLYAGDALLEECAFPVYVGEHGPLEAAF